jgi:hypothetical protein
MLYMLRCKQKDWYSYLKIQKPGSCSDLERGPFNSHLKEGMPGCQWVEFFSKRRILNLPKYLAKDSEMIDFYVI